MRRIVLAVLVVASLAASIDSNAPSANDAESRSDLFHPLDRCSVWRRRSAAPGLCYSSLGGISWLLRKNCSIFWFARSIRRR